MAITTLHTNDAVGAISRLTNLGLKPYAIGDILAAVVAQRLVRRVCTKCAEEYELPTDHPWRERYNLGNGVIKLKRGCGCANCAGTGYKSRISVNEFMMTTPELRNAIQRIARVRKSKKSSGSRVTRLTSKTPLKRPCRVSRRSMRLISCLQIFFEQNPIVLLKGSSINWFRPVHRTAFVALKFLKIFIGVHILFDKTHDNTNRKQISDIQRNDRNVRISFDFVRKSAKCRLYRENFVCIAAWCYVKIFLKNYSQSVRMVV